MLQEEIINEYKNRNEELLNKLEMAKRQVISIKDLAKTYESMKPEEMKPILSNLDDGTVIAIYNSMSSRNKKTIFNTMQKIISSPNFIPKMNSKHFFWNRIIIFYN